MQKEIKSKLKTHRYFAFLRAINVGGHVVKMDELRKLFSAMRFSKVETFIASGNVIFEATSDDANAIERQIEKSLHKSLGYEVVTFLRTFEELQRAADFRPFSDEDLDNPANTLYVGFISAKPTKEARQQLDKLKSDVDELKIHQRELYWLCRTKFSEAQFSGALLERTLGAKLTFRNMNTVRRLVGRFK
ncbi:MAG TPA: DUF1697 domain-containing protein [Pyrinomonadaceae bacterium]|nr:DUF1697 domain-containing protein [Pyrinomonadaceae bacterium]